MSEKDLWKQIKLRLESKSPFLRSILSAVSLESSVLKGKKHFVLNVPSSFHQKILKNYLSEIQAQIKEKSTSDKFLSVKTVFCEKSAGFASSSPLAQKSPDPSSFGKKNIKSRSFFSKWTFSSFVPGSGNNFAFSLAQSVAKQPKANKINPLFIHGPSGLGKTHLLHAIGNFIEQKNLYLKVLYLPAERFFNDCITHIRKNNMSAFRQKYRTRIHVLLLDDIQILGRGESTQEEFFHTFESLKQEGCQIVLTSDQEPKSIKGLKERLKTRFEGGVITDVQIPDKETKIAIIKNKIQRLPLKLSEDIISHIAELPSCSVREIEGHLNKIKMCCELQNKNLSLALIQKLFPKTKTTSSPTLISPFKPYSFSQPKKTAIKALQKEVCARFHIKLADLKSKSRAKKLLTARNLAIYISRTELKLSLDEIGYFFGGRDHSTISNSLKNIDNQQKKNTEISKNIKDLRDFIHKKIFYR